MGKPAELADGHPEQLVEVIVPRRLRRVLGQQHQGVIESIIQTQHQGAQQPLLVGPQGHGLLAELLQRLLQPMNSGLSRWMPEHRQGRIQQAAFDGVAKRLFGEVAQDEIGGLRQHLTFIPSQQGQQNGHLAPLRLPGAALQQA